MRKLCMIIGVVFAFLVFAGIPCLAQCEGDLNCDGTIDGSDLAVFAANFGSIGCPNECLVVIRGFVLSNGLILAGQGYSVSHSSVNNGYTITLDPPSPDFFSNFPTVVVTPYNSAPGIAVVSGFTVNGEFEVHIWDIGGKEIDSTFSFILTLPK